jgi:hypothetical protein
MKNGFRWLAIIVIGSICVVPELAGARTQRLANVTTKLREVLNPAEIVIKNLPVKIDCDSTVFNVLPIGVKGAKINWPNQLREYSPRVLSQHCVDASRRWQSTCLVSRLIRETAFPAPDQIV